MKEVYTQKNFFLSLEANKQKYLFIKGRLFGPYYSLKLQRPFFTDKGYFSVAIKKVDKDYRTIFIHNGKEVEFLNDYVPVNKQIILYNDGESWAALAENKHIKSRKVILANNQIIENIFYAINWPDP